MKCQMEAPGKEYPRSLPYSPPPEENRPPRRFWPCVAFLLVLVIGVESWLLTARSSQSQAAKPVVPEPEPRVNPAPPISVSPGKVPQPEVSKAVLARNTILLETLGAWSASHVYQCYLNLGMLADAVVHQAYTEEEAYAILNTLTGLMQMMDRQIDNVSKAVDSEDRNSLDNIRRLNRLLQVQADALLISWETGDQKKEEGYLQARGKSWDGIREILGIE